MTLTVLRGGHIVDPATGQDAVGDVWFEDGRIVARPDGRKPDQEIDVSGHIVMAGAIDVHSHITGGNVNTARLLLPELRRAIRARLAGRPLSTAKWSTFEGGRLYARMGFATVVEPFTTYPELFALYARQDPAYPAALRPEDRDAPCSYYDELYGLPRAIFNVPDTARANKDAFAEVACRN